MSTKNHENDSIQKVGKSKKTGRLRSGPQMRGVWGVSHPPIISTPGPSCNLMGRSWSRSGPVCIKFLFITPLADSSSVGAVTCYSKAALTYFLGRTDLISGY